MDRYQHSPELMARRCARDIRQHSGDLHETGRCGYMGSLCGSCDTDETAEMLAFYQDAPAPQDGEWAGDYWRRIGGRFYDAWYTCAAAIAKRHGVTFRSI